MTTRNHQDLMNSAYDKCTKDLDKSQRFGSMTNLERVAVLLGNMNYQVENGGISQWIDNGYTESKSLSALNSIITKYGSEIDEKIAKAVLDVIEVAEQYTPIFNENIELYADNEDIEGHLDCIDNAFYAFKSEERETFYQQIINQYDEKLDPFFI